MWPPAGRRGRWPLQQNRKILLNFVGAGALTRPSQTRISFLGGPVWDRPLRRSPDRFPYFCRGGPQTRPLWVLSSRRGGYQPPEAFPLGGRWHGEAVTDEGAIEKTSR